MHKRETKWAWEEDGTKVVRSIARTGPEMNFVGYFKLRYFERFGFKFRMIDSQEASTEITLFKRKFKTPILSGALSGMMDITDKPLVRVSSSL